MYPLTEVPYSCIECILSLYFQGNDVAAVDVSLPEASPLHEIKIILNNLSEDNCPYLVLTTIQQFIHLNNFRNKIINDKLKGSFGTRCNFRVYPPDLSKVIRQHVQFSIFLKKIIIIIILFDPGSTPLSNYRQAGIYQNYLDYCI